MYAGIQELVVRSLVLPVEAEVGGIVQALLVALEEATLEGSVTSAVALPATRAARAALRLQAELKLVEI